MKKTHLVIMIAVVLVVGLLLGSQKQARKWEYARLHFGQDSKWNWRTSGVSVEVRNVKELCEKLEIKISPKEADVFVVINWAGSKGWELIEVIQKPQYAVGWFKRPN